MKRILLFILIFIKTILFAQTSLQHLDIKAANTYEIERRGNVPVNLNMGTIEENIPLFSYKMPDGNNVSIDVSYNSNGFMPSKKSTPVGYNWSLNTGGQISRTVIGKPDDVFNYTQSVQGFLMTVRDNPKSNEAIYNKDYISPNGYNFQYKQLISNNGYSLENQPDRFNFNFMGHNGYFYIGNDGKPVISSESKLKISIDSLTLQMPSTDCEPRFSQIIITDNKGVQYYFGGDEQDLEVLYNLGAVGGGYSVRINEYPDYYITAWHLRKVVYPNNEILYFENKKKNLAWTYRNFCIEENRLPLKTNFTANANLFEANSYFSQTRNFLKSETGGTLLNGGEDAFSSSTVVLNSVIKKVVLDKIKFKNHFTVQFEYTAKPLIQVFDAYLIEKITVKNTTKDLSTINFNYTFNNEYQFLSSVKKDDQNFTMNYYNIVNPLPPSMTRGIDYWGFWNGKSAPNNPLIPAYTLNINNGDFNIVGSTRNPNPDLCDVGLLKKITYPTGGFSEFEYEPNTYSKKVARSIATNFFQNLIDKNDFAGGARIKKITSNDGSGTNNTIKEYKYTSNYQQGTNGGNSSGILENDYIMASFFNQQGGNGWYIISTSETSSNLNISAYTAPVVRYSEVSELVNGNLFTKTNFTDYSTNPDILNYRTEEMGQVSVLELVPPNYVKNNFVPYVSRQNERGKVLKTTYFSNNKILKTIENGYKTINNDNYVTRVWGNAAWVYFTKIYTPYYVLSTTKTNEFSNNLTLETNTSYFYDNPLHNGITKKRTLFSDNNLIETQYKYAHEKANQLMINKNIIGIPLETTSTKIVNGTPHLLAKNESIYPLSQAEADSKTAGFILPVSEQSYDIQNSVPSVDVTYDRYDNKGNVKLYTTKDGAKVGLVWGYNKTLLIAKIEGKDALYFMNMFDMDNEVLSNDSNKDIDLSTEEQFRAKLDIFQSRQNSLDVSITTYTHDPMVGVTSITPPSKIRRIFLYDSTNRLKEIRENTPTGNLLKEFKYNYKN